MAPSGRTARAFEPLDIYWLFPAEADFELKGLLKTAQLRYGHLAKAPVRRIDVIVKGDTARRDYEAFFGSASFQYFNQGLEGYVSDLDHHIALPSAPSHHVS